MKKIFDGVYMLEGEVGGRPLQLMYLRSNDRSLLLDTGCAGDSGKFIFREMRDAGGTPEELSFIINTHPDLDHTGGNHELKQSAPASILACGDSDRSLCEDFENLFRFRYNPYCAEHGICLGSERYAGMKERGGRPQPVDMTFIGGEKIRMAEDWILEVLSLPGHARGHLGILDPKHNALYGGDAIHGRVYLSLKGEAVFPPTYLHVDDYLSTIRYIEQLPVETYIGCHWPVMHGNEIRDFCAESRQFVSIADELLRKALGTPRTLKDLCSLLGPQLGDWPRELDRELVFALYGHLERLVARRIAASRLRDRDPHVLEFYLI